MCSYFLAKRVIHAEPLIRKEEKNQFLPWKWENSRTSRSNCVSQQDQLFSYLKTSCIWGRFSYIACDEDQIEETYVTLTIYCTVHVDEIEQILIFFFSTQLWNWFKTSRFPLLLPHPDKKVIFYLIADYVQWKMWNKKFFFVSI